ncbi:MAG TPA: hypothetical protein VJK52_01020 [Candidatus Nanoarchaeia archaeon]|nr:hypothetical protein [Candidatus Nanoarchaeia archaeon]
MALPESITTAHFCPRCKSTNIRLVEYMGKMCIVCNDCGYDERQQYEIYPEQKTSQREKERFSPYRIGGARRTAK